MPLVKCFCKYGYTHIMGTQATTTMAICRDRPYMGRLAAIIAMPTELDIIWL